MCCVFDADWCAPCTWSPSWPGCGVGLRGCAVAGVGVERALQVGGAANSPATVYDVAIEDGNIIVDTSKTGQSGVLAA